MVEAEYHPGEPAPVSSVFYETNVFGTLTGRMAHLGAGDLLPGAPVGFHWVIHTDASCYEAVGVVWHDIVEDDAGRS